MQILVTHTPPNGILDRTRRGVIAGCESLKSRLSHLKDIKLHVFGHIHEASGAIALPGRCLIAVNAALANQSAPIYVVDLPND